MASKLEMVYLAPLKLRGWSVSPRSRKHIKTHTRQSTDASPVVSARDIECDVREKLRCVSDRIRHELTYRKLAGDPAMFPGPSVARSPKVPEWSESFVVTQCLPKLETALPRVTGHCTDVLPENTDAPTQHLEKMVASVPTAGKAREPVGTDTKKLLKAREPVGTDTKKRLSSISVRTVLGRMIAKHPERALKYGLVVSHKVSPNKPWPPPPLNPIPTRRRDFCFSLCKSTETDELEVENTVGSETRSIEQETVAERLVDKPFFANKCTCTFEEEGSKEIARECSSPRRFTEERQRLRKYLRCISFYKEDFARLNKSRTGKLTAKDVQKMMHTTVQPRNKEDQEVFGEWVREIDRVASPDGWSFDEYLWFLALIERKKFEEKENSIREAAIGLAIPKCEVEELRVIFGQIDGKSRDLQKRELSYLLRKLRVPVSAREHRAKELFDEFCTQKPPDGLTFVNFLHLAKKLNSDPMFFKEVSY